MKAGANDTICNGDSIQLNATGCISYSWSPASGLSSTNISNPFAKPIVTTTYVVSSNGLGNNLVVNGDFSSGNTGFTTGYAYTTYNTVEGQYFVGTASQLCSWNCGMECSGDHTSGTGNMMFVNGSPTANTDIWCETISVAPNTNYTLTAWATSLNSSGPMAILQFIINGQMEGSPLTLIAKYNSWTQFSATWNSGSSTTAAVCIVDENISRAANDFALDDISFSTLNSMDSLIITVNSPATSNTKFVNQLINLGDSVSYTVSALGTAPFTYQWIKDDKIIKGATNIKFKNKSITCLDTGLYSCIIRNICDSITVKVSHLYVQCSRFRHAITGLIKYDNKDSTLITNTNVNLANTGDTIIENAITDNSGFYVLLNLINGNYKLSCSSTKEWGGVNPLDALIVNRYYIGMYKITDPLKLLAADVNDDKKINPTDALMMNRRYIGMLNKFTIPDWLFNNPKINMSGVNTSQNIIAICAGDVNASYIPPTRIMNYKLGIRNEEQIKIDINKPFDIPIYLNDNAELGVIGIKLLITNYKLQITGIKSDLDGLIYNITDAGVNIAWTAENVGYNITQDKPLFYLTAIINTSNNLTSNNLISITSESVLADIDANNISIDKLSIPNLRVNSPNSTVNFVCYPNPFGNITNINYTLKEDANVEINLYNVFGEKVAALIKNERQQAGNYNRKFDCSNLKQGIYYCKIEVHNENYSYSKTNIMMIAR